MIAIAGTPAVGVRAVTVIERFASPAATASKTTAPSRPAPETPGAPAGLPIRISMRPAASSIFGENVVCTPPLVRNDPCVAVRALSTAGLYEISTRTLPSCDTSLI